ncbi:MAG: six-cysteine ranthipeptide SCIFF [Bacillota bacterium]
MHIKPVIISDACKDVGEKDCEGCEASCQTACKTSCTVGNQVCQD